MFKNVIALETVMVEQPTRRVFVVEDEKVLVREAQEHLPDNYYVFDVPLGEASKPHYWEGLSLTPHDLLVVDLNLKVGYSGKEVLRMLEREKKFGRFSGLEQVLVATAIPGAATLGGDTEIAFMEGFRIYGFQKGVRETPAVLSTGRVVDRPEMDMESYGSGLARRINEIYNGTAIVLNSRK